MGYFVNQSLNFTDMITLSNIQAAQKRLKGICVRTPLIPFSKNENHQQLFFKPENLQPVGAFKLRGAYNKIASLTDAEKKRGIIAFSSGNHAQGVAYAAQKLGIKATIVMPAIAPTIKVANTKAMGAEVVLLQDGGEEEWRVAAEVLAAKHNYVMIPPFNDETIIAGQATVGMEIMEDLPDVGVILVPIGGGGLISGVAAALKLSGKTTKVIGVEPAIANDAQQSFRQGTIQKLPLSQTRQTMADGMRATQIGDITFAHIQAFVDDIITVSEEEIKMAMQQMLLNSRLVSEPSGAVSAAAFLFKKELLPKAASTVAVISGGNIAPNLLVELLQ